MEKTFIHQWQIGNVSMKAEISPCCWMHETYGLQLKISIAGGGDAYLHRKELPFSEATEEDVKALCDTVKLKPCKCGCGNPAFDPDSIETNRSGKCEACFMAEWNKRVEEIEKKERQKIARHDKRMYQKGYRYKAEAWVHPRAGGDDHQVALYFASEPTEQSIQKELQKAGSAVTNDYVLTALSGE